MTYLVRSVGITFSVHENDLGVTLVASGGEYPSEENLTLFFDHLN